MQNIFQPKNIIPSSRPSNAPQKNIMPPSRPSNILEPKNAVLPSRPSNIFEPKNAVLPSRPSNIFEPKNAVLPSRPSNIFEPKNVMPPSRSFNIFQQRNIMPTSRPSHQKNIIPATRRSNIFQSNKTVIHGQNNNVFQNGRNIFLEQYTNFNTLQYINKQSELKRQINQVEQNIINMQRILGYMKKKKQLLEEELGNLMELQIQASQIDQLSDLSEYAEYDNILEVQQVNTEIIRQKKNKNKVNDLKKVTFMKYYTELLDGPKQSLNKLKIKLTSEQFQLLNFMCQQNVWTESEFNENKNNYFQLKDHEFKNKKKKFWQLVYTF